MAFCVKGIPALFPARCGEKFWKVYDMGAQADGNSGPRDCFAIVER